ncbi:hypothetical protein [Treponema sp.]|uniref:hypothetical protein n=1 Tax=Treponema sp. TaxID=166 RepID=UPI003F0B3F7D
MDLLASNDALIEKVKSVSSEQIRLSNLYTGKEQTDLLASNDAHVKKSEDR